MSFVDGGGYELNSAIMTAERALVKSLRKRRGRPKYWGLIFREQLEIDDDDEILG
jgi:hypothetical protein